MRKAKTTFVAYRWELEGSGPSVRDLGAAVPLPAFDTLPADWRACSGVTGHRDGLDRVPGDDALAGDRDAWGVCEGVDLVCLTRVVKEAPEALVRARVNESLRRAGERADKSKFRRMCREMHEQLDPVAQPRFAMRDVVSVVPVGDGYDDVCYVLVCASSDAVQMAWKCAAKAAWDDRGGWKRRDLASATLLRRIVVGETSGLWSELGMPIKVVGPLWFEAVEGGDRDRVVGGVERSGHAWMERLAEEGTFVRRVGLMMRVGSRVYTWQADSDGSVRGWSVRDGAEKASDMVPLDRVAGWLEWHCNWSQHAAKMLKYQDSALDVPTVDGAVAPAVGGLDAGATVEIATADERVKMDIRRFRQVCKESGAEFSVVEPGNGGEP